MSLRARPIEIVSSIAWWGWTLLGAVGLFVTLAGSYAFRPQIDLSVGETLDPKVALATRFVATNRSFYKLEGVFFACAYSGGSSGPIQVAVVPGSYDYFPAGSPFSVYCGGTSLPHVEPQKLLMEVVVFYQLPFIGHLFSSSALFFMKRNAVGEAKWISVVDHLSHVEAVQYFLTNPRAFE